MPRRKWPWVVLCFCFIFAVITVTSYIFGLPCGDAANVLVKSATSTVRTPSSTVENRVFISVKTTPKYYENRMRVLKNTWFTRVLEKDKLSVVSDFVNNNYSEFEFELRKEGFQLVVSNCSLVHSMDALCCKSGIEYQKFYLASSKHRLDWFCHFDDDIYVNLKELWKVLQRYNPSKPYYIGRYPREENVVDLGKYRFSRLKEHYNATKRFYVYSAGAAYCISSTLMMELKDYFNGPKRFKKTCLVTVTSDDLTIGIIINSVLKYNLTFIETMYSQREDLTHLSTQDLTKLITFSYRTTGESKRIYPRINPQPMKFVSDPTRFLTYHCLLYNETWCPVE